MPRLFSEASGALLALVLAASGFAAVPVPPDQVAYSGLLVDGGGIPLAGPVDLAARVYDAANAGTLVFKQSFTGVALEDGHFTLNLGPNGAATDSPTDPLTTSLRTALTGDLPAGTGRFVEITVDSDPPLARVQLVLVPYALRADHATTSDLASTALDAQAVTGLPGGVVTELFEHYNADGGPPSADPSEGFGDTDNDGELNFVDSDNDNDTLSDTLEVTNGSDINLVTPSVSAVTPSGGQGDQVTPVTVTGNSFLPGITAQLGSQVLTPSNITSTSFDTNVGLDAGPYPAARNLTVTLANGQSFVKAAAFTFSLLTPVITSVTPSSGPGFTVTQVTVAGTGFVPGLTAQFGGQSAAVSNLSSTSFQAAVGPDLGPYPKAVDLLAMNPSGATGARSNAFTFLAQPPVTVPFAIASTVVPISIVAQGNELLLYGSQATTVNRYAMDTITDASVLFDVVADFASRTPSALSWNTSRVVHGLRASATNQIQLLKDANANNQLEDGEAVVLESGGTPYTRSPSLTFDSAGRPAGGYIRTGVSGGTLARAFHDRDGNGLFTGPNELVTIETVGSVMALGDAQFDLSGKLAYVFYNLPLGAIRVAWDRSGDGDFADSVAGLPELQSALVVGTPSCLAASFDGSGRLAIVYARSNVPNLLYDLNGDLDFADAGEATVLPGSGNSSACDIARSPLSGRLAIAFNRVSELRLAVDSNDDGDFLDADEFRLMSTGLTSGPVSVAVVSDGSVRLYSPLGVHVSGPPL